MIGTQTLGRATALPQTHPQPPFQDPRPSAGRWTYEDWLRLPDDGFRYEVLDGELYMVPPSSIRHQRVSFRLAVAMANYVSAHHLGEVLEAPCGVRLPGQPVPVQPDIFFIRNERLHILGREYVEGAPDLVVEVLSPTNRLYDRREKFLAYQEAGVTEYWIVDPRAATIEIFALEEGAFALIGRFGRDETARSRVLAGFEVVVGDILAE